MNFLIILTAIKVLTGKAANPLSGRPFKEPAGIVVAMIVFRKRKVKYFCFVLGALVLLAVFFLQVPDTNAKKKQSSEKPDALHAAGAPVVLNEKPLFYVRARILSFSQEERAKLIEERIRKLAKDPLFHTDSIAVSDAETTSEIAAGDLVIMTVTEKDAKAAGKNRADIAKEYALAIGDAIKEQRQAYSMKAFGTGVLWALALTVLFVLLFIGLKKLLIKINSVLNAWRGVRIPAIRYQSLEILSSDSITNMLIQVARWIRILLLLIGFYFYVVLLLALFPWTKNLSSKIFGYVVTPLRMIGDSFVSYLPKLFFVFVIVLITYYGLKFIKFIFAAVEKGIITFPGFYTEWARPTYEIVRFLVICFAAVVAFPYLPGSDSPAFKGVSIFIGVLLSLGSTAAVANVVAGLILTYMRAFRVGDRIKISDTTGDVIEKTLLITRLRTIKNEDITIPNAMILGSHITNFSSLVDKSGLILHTSVTIGYDAPWRKVHELLIAAAGKTDRILANPAPFVLQTGLDDFYVRYELNAYTDQPAKMAAIYSELHQNIQDAFNEAGVEIMSPHYSSLRDGNRTAIPEEHLPTTYIPRAFRIFRADDPVKTTNKKPE